MRYAILKMRYAHQIILITINLVAFAQPSITSLSAIPAKLKNAFIYLTHLRLNYFLTGKIPPLKNFKKTKGHTTNACCHVIFTYQLKCE